MLISLCKHLLRLLAEHRANSCCRQWDLWSAGEEVGRQNSFKWSPNTLTRGHSRSPWGLGARTQTVMTELCVCVHLLHIWQAFAGNPRTPQLSTPTQHPTRYNACTCTPGCNSSDRLRHPAGCAAACSTKQLLPTSVSTHTAQPAKACTGRQAVATTSHSQDPTLCHPHGGRMLRC
jgi:hypothetical protein